MTANLITPKTKKISLYSDMHKDLRVSPISKDIALLKDEDAVRESLRNLILTDPGERLMQPRLGAGIRELLFENLTPGVLKLIERRIKSTIETYEPRAELIDVSATSIFDDNKVSIVVRFNTRNVDTPIQLDVILERIR